MWRRAFSLVELFTVIAIVGVIASLATTSLAESNQRARARAELRDVEAFFTKAGTLARMRRECAQLVIAAGGRSLDLTLHPRPSSGCDFATASTRPPASFRYPATGDSQLLFSSTKTLQVENSGSLLDASVPYVVSVASPVAGSSAVFTVSQGTATVRRQ